MNENTLLKISLIISLIGVIGLFIILQNASIDEKTIEKVTSGDLNKKVKITGTASKVVRAGEATIISVAKPSEINVVLFGGNISFKEGAKIEVIGEVEEYNGKPEIIAQRVRVIN